MLMTTPSPPLSCVTSRPLLDGLPEMLTTREGARLLRCSKAHFCNLLNGVVSGVPPLPYLQLGRRRLVRKATLIEWIERVESAATLRCYPHGRPRQNATDA